MHLEYDFLVLASSRHSTSTAAGGGARARKTLPRRCCARSAQTHAWAGLALSVLHSSRTTPARRRSPCTATSPVIESTFCGFLIPEESDCVPSILELHAAWEAIFVDDVNIWDTAGRSAQPEKSCPIRGSAFMWLWFLRPSKTSWNRFPDLVPEIPCTSCMCLDISQTKTQCPAENVCNLWL
jgi:hypothetical protein